MSSIKKQEISAEIGAAVVMVGMTSEVRTHAYLVGKSQAEKITSKQKIRKHSYLLKAL